MRVAVNRFNQLRASNFIRNITVVVSGAATAQFITILCSPFLTRLYGPEAFGLVGIFTSAALIIASVSDLMYGAAIVLPRTDREARTLFKLSFIICCLVTIISLVAFGLFREQVAEVIGFSASPMLLVFAPALVLLSGVCQPLHHWLYRMENFRAISLANVIEATANNISKVLIGLIAATAPSLLILSIMSKLLQACLLWVKAQPTLMRDDTTDCEAQSRSAATSLSDVAYRYRDFPLFRAPQKWLVVLSYSAPSLVLAALIGPVSAGFYLLANRVIYLPNIVIADAASPVFLTRIADASHRSERLRPILIRGTVALAMLGLLPYGLVMAAGPQIFSFIFGVGWGSAGNYARWLALPSYFAFVAVPTISAIPIIGLQGQFLAYEVAVTAISIVSLAGGILMLQSDIAAIASMSTATALMTVMQITWCLMHCDTHTRSSASVHA